MIDLELDSIRLLFGDYLERMRELPDNSIDAVITDPPYGLSFMGKDWDHGVPSVSYWAGCLRVAKPGSYLLAFGGTRTSHRLACAIEDAGWEIRDCIMWVYGTGWPKSLDVSKAIDKAAGVKRKIIGYGDIGRASKVIPYSQGAIGSNDTRAITAPATNAAKQWQGWGTALKPAYEPIIMARKPLVGTVAANVLEYGCGGLNIDGCRVEGEKRSPGFKNPKSKGHWGSTEQQKDWNNSSGRWPANFIHDGSEEVVELFPQTGKSTGFGGQGSAARFFYCAKADKSERGEGNTAHPTVKPLALMRYLCRLVTPPNGIILDPFMGSGSTGVAAQNEGFGFVGIENNSDYFIMAAGRIFEWRD